MGAQVDEVVVRLCAEVEDARWDACGAQLTRLANEFSDHPLAQVCVANAWHHGRGDWPINEATAEEWDFRVNEDRLRDLAQLHAAVGEDDVDDDDAAAAKDMQSKPKLGAEAPMQSRLQTQQISQQAATLARFYLASMLRRSRGTVTRNQAEAVRLLRPLAAQRFAPAQCLLGLMHDSRADGLVTDDRELFRLMRLAGLQGVSRAQVWCGWCCEKGRGVERNLEQSVRWYRRAAEQGYAEGQYFLGLSYEYGDGVSMDHDEAVQWYRRAAAQGCERAECRMGICYELGRGVQRDCEEAVRWYRRAADHDDSDGQRYLGVCYEYGRGMTRKSELQALRWYHRAAMQGDAQSQRFVAEFCTRGVAARKSFKQALRWYRLAALQGNLGSQTNAGWCCYTALHEEPEHADSEAPGADVDARVSMSLGRLTECHQSQVLPWMYVAAINGDSQAQCNVGVLLQRGYSMPEPKLEPAAGWCRLAAAQGVAQAQYNLGWCYETGFGLRQNRDKAIRWYRLAAHQGLSEAAQALQRNNL